MRTVFEPLGAEFSSVIVTGLFAANEPQPGDPWGLTSRRRAPVDDQQRARYMAAWYHTIKNCGWYAVILHDGLSRAFIETWGTPRIRFAYFPGDSDAPRDWSFRYPPHERRFFAMRTFLAHQPYVHFAFLTDINSGGILVKADPQKFFTAAYRRAPAGTPAFDDLVFVSEENQPMFRDGVMRPFWRDHTARCDLPIRELFAAWPFAQSLCVGIWGAAAATARVVLTDLTAGIVGQRESGRQILVPIDQVIFMDVLYRRYFLRLVNFYSGTPRLWYQGNRSLLSEGPYAWFRRPAAPPLLIADSSRIPAELQGRNDVLLPCAELFYSPIGRGPVLAKHDVRWWQPGDLQGTDPVRYEFV
ncbi:MAG: hypothetical protein JNK76_08565 [Planctomycetales bacterium]|nr:hypothetical protein [Planctomycetales bacterium]